MMVDASLRSKPKSKRWKCWRIGHLVQWLPGVRLFNNSWVREILYRTTDSLVEVPTVRYLPLQDKGENSWSEDGSDMTSIMFCYRYLTSNASPPSPSNLSPIPKLSEKGP